MSKLRFWGGAVRKPQITIVKPYNLKVLMKLCSLFWQKEYF